MGDWLQLAVLDFDPDFDPDFDLDFDPDFDEEDARAAGEVRALLAPKDAPIGPRDVSIAGRAPARNVILVTRNPAEFSRVPGLQIEDREQ